MTDAKPYPKSQQLARGAKRYRRKVASPKQWQAIIAAKQGPCRVCQMPLAHGGYGLQLHHVVPRDLHGDDVADNITPLCEVCHGAVTLRFPEACKPFVAALTDAEYAYAIDKAGEGVFERVYGIEYGR